LSRPGLQRFGLALAALAVVALVVVVALPLAISTETVRERVGAEIRFVTGTAPAMRGPVSVSLFPASQVSFGDVAIGDTADPALKAETMVARLRFFPLLLGRVEVADITLEKPSILINVGTDRSTNWSALSEALARRPSDTGEGFSEVRIVDGRVVVRDAARDTAEVFDSVDLSLAWPAISKSFGATGRLNWRGESIEAALSLGDFSAALAGRRSGLKLRVSGTQVKGAFDGAFTTLPSMRLEGTLIADGASLRDVLRWAGQKPLPGGGFGRFAIKAHTNVVGGTIALSSVNLELDGNAAEGVLTFAADGRKTLQGTLAAESIDLTPYISTVRLATSQREWNRGPFTLDGLSSFDADLRLSAGKATLGNIALGRAALGATLRGGHLTVTVGESQAFGGLLKGTAAISNQETTVDIKTQLQFTDVELDQCLGQLLGVSRIEGKGNLAVSLEGSGDSVLALTRTISGVANLTARNGSLTGINIEQLLRRLERRPLSAGSELRSGRTPFERLTVRLKATNGIITTEDGTMEGTAVRVALAGQAAIPDRELDLKGTAQLLLTDKSKEAFELPFVVVGPWDSPLILPDPQSLIRRSGAAAPLLNAVRERRPRAQAETAAPAAEPPSKPAE